MNVVALDLSNVAEKFPQFTEVSRKLALEVVVGLAEGKLNLEMEFCGQEHGFDIKGGGLNQISILVVLRTVGYCLLYEGFTKYATGKGVLHEIAKTPAPLRNEYTFHRDFDLVFPGYGLEQVPAGLKIKCHVGAAGVGCVFSLDPGVGELCLLPKLYSSVRVNYLNAHNYGHESTESEFLDAFTDALGSQFSRSCNTAEFDAVVEKLMQQRNLN